MDDIIRRDTRQTVSLNPPHPPFFKGGRKTHSPFEKGGEKDLTPLWKRGVRGDFPATRKFPPAIFLMGPTATGKTELAAGLVERLPCEIISVDSAMVYRGMDIGTAKPDAAILARAPHRLIDVLDPSEAYSAARFREDALREMADVARGGRIPLLVGGAMLYFRVLERGLSVLPPADTRLRARIDQQAQELGPKGLHRRLQAVDPEAAARIHPHDPQRLQRALEIYEITGRPLTELYARPRSPILPYRLIKLALKPADREAQRERIARRFRQMLDQGFLDEVKALHRRMELHPSLPSIRAVGYRQLWAYLDGRSDYDSMTARAIAATRQLAKRQLTWLRKEADAVSVAVETCSVSAIIDIINARLD